MSNPTSMQMFQHDVQEELVAGFMCYPDPEPEDTQVVEEDEPEDDKESSIGGN